MDFKGSEVDGNHTVYEIEFRNFHKLENYFKVKFKEDLRIVKGTTTLVNLQAGANEATYFSEYGIATTNAGVFIPGTLEEIEILPYSDEEVQIYKFRVLTSEVDKFEVIGVSREIL